MAILDHDVGTRPTGSSPEGAPHRPVGKSEKAFRTIAEVAFDLQLPAHVLRFWESKFPQIKPLKRRGGRRYYRPEDIDLLRHIRTLLYTEGYTIRGVQRLLKETGARSASAGEPERDTDTAAGNHEEGGFHPSDPAEVAEAAESCAEDSLGDVLDELEALRALLRSHGF
jgi:DNA-binding transcriptional MerR regulator